MVFQTLLQMVPGLERRLMEDSDEAVAAVAELVSHYTCLVIRVQLCTRSRRVSLVPGLTIRRALKALCLTGSPRAASRSIRHYLEM